MTTSTSPGAPEPDLIRKFINFPESANYDAAKHDVKSAPGECLFGRESV